MKYIQAIVIGLQNLFSDVDNLGAFAIFDPQKLTVPVSEDNIAAYGKERLEYLKNTYGDGMNPDMECTDEWEDKKKCSM